MAIAQKKSNRWIAKTISLIVIFAFTFTQILPSGFSDVANFKDADLQPIPQKNPSHPPTLLEEKLPETSIGFLLANDSPLGAATDVEAKASQSVDPNGSLTEGLVTQAVEPLLITDSSPSTHVVMAHGDAHIDDTQSKFGGASGLFDGAGDYLSIPDSDDWDFGQRAFTIDFWVRFNTLGEAPQTLTDRGNTASWRVTKDSDGALDV
ncbi:MAG: hypothetical protein HY583_01615, partial [Candidatus Omnitrophica bacterium]|nr:hypothetical protein [Candidatus Omnitrophota bacterium]